MSTANTTAFARRAQALQPLISQYRQWGQQHRDLAPDLVAALHDAGLFRLYQPKRWGGAELDPREFWSIQAILAECCLSTAWVQGVLSVQSFLLALFPEQAQADVWGHDTTALVSSSFQPTGKVTAAGDGYTLSGHWTFSSGSSFAQWVLVGGLVTVTGQPPQMALFLVPRSDYQLNDTWHTFGLRATGSNDVVIEEAFVPRHRVLFAGAGMVPNVTTNTLSALYQLPWLYVFTGGIAYLGIGACRAALADFIAIAKTRRGIVTGKAVKEDPEVHRTIATTQAAINRATALYHTHIAAMMQHIAQRQPMADNQGVLQRVEMMGVMRELTRCVDAMRLLLGGRGVREDSPLTQHWLDMNAACAHPGNDPRAIEHVYGLAQLV